jgi:hypothetical protein
MSDMLQENSAKKKFVLLLPWTKLSSAHLVKDVGLFPEYFKNEYGLSAEIVFTGENETQQEFFQSGERAA